MKYNRIKIIIGVLALAVTTIASAQTMRSSYFMEGMNYRHQLNPAFVGENSYINLPFFVLGNFNVGTQGNVGVNNFLYKYNQNGYTLTTFMNEAINSQEFLSGLKDMNHLNANISLPIVAFGFKKWGGFNTFDLGIRSNNSINLPYSLFDFMKNGMTQYGGTYYNLKNLRVRTNTYVEVAFGHARDIDDKLSVGAKFKFLVGAANMDAHIKNMDIYMSEDKWDIVADGRLDGSMKGASFKTKEANEAGQEQIDGIKVKNPGVGGYGAAIDLGAVYRMDDFVEGLTLSASLLDLGFIYWSNALKGSMIHSYTFEGFEHPVAVNPEPDNPNDIDTQIDKIKDELEGFWKFYEDEPAKSRTTMLGATFNAGAEYALPCYEKLRFGLLSSTYINRPFTWTEARLSANVAPVEWFEASINYGISKFGSSLGWVINFRPRGFNFFIGTDHQFFRITPQFVPVGRANMSVNMGFNITWNHKKKYKVTKPDFILEY